MKIEQEIQKKFLKNQRIQHDLSALQANGLEFSEVGVAVEELVLNEYRVSVYLLRPYLSNKLLSRKNIANAPMVSLHDNILLFNENIEIVRDKAPSKKFLKLQEVLPSGIKPDIFQQDEKQELKHEENRLQLELEVMFNAQLSSLSEDIKEFENEMLSFLEQFYANLGESGNRNVLLRVIKQFKNSTVKNHTTDTFRYVYKASIMNKKEELKKYQSAQWKLRQNIINIFSMPSIMRQLTLIKQKINTLQMQTQHLRDKMNQIHDEIDNLVESAFVDLILEQQSYSHNNSFTEDIKISKFELYKYCLPRFFDLLNFYQIDRSMIKIA